MDLITYNTLHSQRYYAPQPSPPPAPMIPTTYCTPHDYNIIYEKYGDDIRRAIAKNIANATEALITLITDKILSTVDPKIDTNIEEKINDFFSAFNALTEEEINEITTQGKE